MGGTRNQIFKPPTLAFTGCLRKCPLSQSEKEAVIGGSLQTFGKPEVGKPSEDQDNRHHSLSARRLLMARAVATIA